uniref:tRNA pseudouridine synthase B n=1 Tax=Desulfobacca acetoxidans TaxID=60893 RepID=A0A7V4LBS9_9BACT
MENILASGLLLIDKPPGMTSFEVVRRGRRALRVKKVGHLGTLDPLATGLLPLALGEATKLAQFLLEEPKTYLATVRFGVETDTQDAAGRVVAQTDRLPGEGEIRRAAAGFQGELLQRPPAYSAVRHEGRRLYKLARQGVEVAPEPRRVVIHRLEIRELALPLMTILVECSKGTYVRTLAHDLGQALGCGAHLAALTRLAVGPFRLEDALPLAQVEEDPEGALRTGLIPLPACLPRFRALEVDRRQARRLAQGQALPWPGNSLAEGEKVRVLSGGDLVAVAMLRSGQSGRELAPLRVFVARVAG